MTTFLTPFGRYSFNKLPFRIQISRVLEDLEGVVCLIDDVIIYGANQEVDDSRLKAVLEQMERAGVTLNSEKCSFSQPQLKFLGHIIDKCRNLVISYYDH